MVDGSLPQERSDFYVYVIFRPNGVPCYVGKGKGCRWDEHFRKARNSHLANIIASSSIALPRVKVRENLTEDEAFELEIALIAAIGRKCHGGPLTNLTDGGEGALGARHSDEWTRKISQLHKGRKHTPEAVANMSAAQKLRFAQLGYQPSYLSRKGKKATPQTLEKMSRSAKERGAIPPSRAGATPSESTKLKQSNSMKAYWASVGGMSEAARVALSVARKGIPSGRKRTDEERAAISKKLIGRSVSDKARAATSAAKKGIPLTTEHREKLRLAWIRRKAKKDDGARSSKKNCGWQLTLPL